MKKLLTILVICVLAVSLYAVENPFTFSLSSKLQGKFKDTSQPGYMSQSSGSDSPLKVQDSDNNFAVGNASLKAVLDAGMSTTIADIYTLSFGITEQMEVADNGSNELNFKVMGNSIKVIPDYLTIGFDLKWNLFHAAAAQVTGRFDMVFSLSGGVPDAGFSWGLTSDNRLNFNLWAFSDTDPTNSGTVAASTGDDNTKGPLESYYTENKLALTFNVGKFFMPENMSLSIVIDPVLKITVPYCYEKDLGRTIATELNPGINLGLAGFNVGMFCYIATSDTISTSAPAGSMGSAYTYNVNGPDGTDHTSTAGYVDSEHGQYAFVAPSGSLNVGPKLTLGFTKGMGSFGFMWKGNVGNLRDPNWSKDNRANGIWTNEFEIDVTIAL